MESTRQTERTSADDNDMQCGHVAVPFMACPSGHNSAYAQGFVAVQDHRQRLPD
jgi:hypothetical protein